MCNHPPAQLPAERTKLRKRNGTYKGSDLYPGIAKRRGYPGDPSWAKVVPALSVAAVGLAPPPNKREPPIAQPMIAQQAERSGGQRRGGGTSGQWMDGVTSHCQSQSCGAPSDRPCRKVSRSSSQPDPAVVQRDTTQTGWCCAGRRRGKSNGCTVACFG